LSSNGRRIAIGVPQQDDGGGDTGYLYIKNKSSLNNTWAGTSENIAFSIPGDSGEASGARFGYTVAMTPNGTHVIASAPFDDNDVGTDAGLAKLYKLPEAIESGTIYYNSDGILRVAL